MAYNAFLRGSSSDAVVHTPFARHRQTFKAREYVVFESPTLRVGHTLDAFLPEKPTINKTPSGIEIEGIEYLAVADLTEEQKEGETVQDVLILGEVAVNRPLILPSCLWSDPTGTLFVGTIPHSWSCETVRRVSQHPQGLCTSLTRFHGRYHFLISPLEDGRRSGDVVVSRLSRWRRRWVNSWPVERHSEPTGLSRLRRIVHDVP
jgi:hypothetical protein